MAQKSSESDLFCLSAFCCLEMTPSYFMYYKALLIKVKTQNLAPSGDNFICCFLLIFFNSGTWCGFVCNNQPSSFRELYLQSVSGTGREKREDNI